jgi:2-dehydropantoate 2-reductase
MADNLKDALALGPFDAAIFALKSFDTRQVLQSLLPDRESVPPIVCFQNGVENEETIAAALGEMKVIPGTVTSAIGRRAAGDIVLERLRGVGIAGGHPLSAVLVSTLGEAGLNAHLFPAGADMKWSKLLTNLLANASSAILDLSPAEIFAHPGLYRLEMDQIDETLRVMSALGVRVVDLPGTPVRLLAFAVQRLPAALSRPLLGRAVGSGRGGKMPSFHIDLHGGRGKSEVDYLNGAVVRFGDRLGIPTPANRMLNETLLALTEGELPLDAFRKRPDLLLDRLKE